MFGKLSHLYNYNIFADGFKRVHFLSWFVNDLLPVLNPVPNRNSVLVLDNASIHHWHIFKSIIRYLGIHVIYLPPYSPDINGAIEEFWRDVKRRLKLHRHLYRRHPRTALRLILATMGDYNIEPILNRIGYSRYCARRR